MEVGQPSWARHARPQSLTQSAPERTPSKSKRAPPDAEAQYARPISAAAQLHPNALLIAPSFRHNDSSPIHPSYLLNAPHPNYSSSSSLSSREQPWPPTHQTLAGQKRTFPDLHAANSGPNRKAKSTASPSQQFRPFNWLESDHPYHTHFSLCHPQAQITTKPRKSRSRFAFQGRHGDRELFWLQIRRHLGSPFVPNRDPHCSLLSLAGFGGKITRRPPRGAKMAI